jgi:hypothetical protein
MANIPQDANLSLSDPVPRKNAPTFPRRSRSLMFSNDFSDLIDVWPIIKIDVIEKIPKNEIGDIVDIPLHTNECHPIDHPSITKKN